MNILALGSFPAWDQCPVYLSPVQKLANTVESYAWGFVVLGTGVGVVLFLVAFGIGKMANSQMITAYGVRVLVSCVFVGLLTQLAPGFVKSFLTGCMSPKSQEKSEKENPKAMGEKHKGITITMNGKTLS